MRLKLERREGRRHAGRGRRRFMPVLYLQLPREFENNTSLRRLCCVSDGRLSISSARTTYPPPSHLQLSSTWVMTSTDHQHSCSSSRIGLPPGVPCLSMLYLKPPPMANGTNHTESLTPLSSNTGDEIIANRTVLHITVAITFYIAGVLFGFVWIATRDYNRQDGPPWVPKFCRTEICCAWFEPVIRFWPAYLWPLFLLCVFIYFIIEKAMDATNCCGQELRRSRRRRRLKSVHRDICASGLVCEPSGAASPYSSIISTPPHPVPQATYDPRFCLGDLSSWDSSSKSMNSFAPISTRPSRTTRMSWVAIPGRGYGTPPPIYQSRVNSARSSNATSISSTPGQSRSRSSSTLSADLEAARPVSMQIKRISITYDKAPSPLRTSESIAVNDLPVEMQMGNSSAQGSDSGGSSLVMQSGGLSGDSSRGKGKEKSAEDQGREKS